MQFHEGKIPPDLQRPDLYPNEESNLTEGESEAFDIAGFINRIPYPATKQDILDFAEDEGLGPEVLENLDQLPDVAYNSPDDVSQAWGEDANI